MSDMIKVTIDDREVKELTEQLLEKAINTEPVMRKIAGIMFSAVEENFEQEGRPAWPELSPVTIKQREKEGKWPGKILQKSQGGLAASIQEYHNEETAIVGTNKEYARIHQFGGKAGRNLKVTIPARPFLKITDEDLDDIKEVLKEHLSPK